jgi:hypothetical protein
VPYAGLDHNLMAVRATVQSQLLLGSKFPPHHPASKDYMLFTPSNDSVLEEHHQLIRHCGDPG